MSRGAFDEKAKGRLVDEKWRRVHRAGRAGFRAAQKADQAGGGAGPATGAVAGAAGHQAVIKVVSWGKSSRSAITTARYITRTRAKDAPEAALAATAPDGTQVTPDHLRAYVEAWDLIPDAENLTPEARAASREDRLQMPEKDRLNKRQIGHMILSIPAIAGARPEQVEAIARDTLTAVFEPQNVDYLYVVHTDHSDRPHAHVMFRATSHGKQLRMGPEDLRVIREIFAEKGRAHGVALIATAREDRAGLAPILVQGAEQVRPNRRYIDAKAHAADQLPWLAQRAPLYHARHGAAYQQRFLGVAPSSPLPPLPAIVLPAFPRKTGRLIENACKSFVDPAAAQRNFAELYAEAPQFALWAMNNRPEVIGARSPGAKPTKLYLRQKDVAPERPRFEDSLTRMAELDQRMTVAYGADWKARLEGEIKGSDAPSQLPIVRAESQQRAAILRDPQLNQGDPLDRSLKDWREEARRALSKMPPEPRPIAAARAAAERASRSALTQLRQARNIENNLALIDRAGDRFGLLPGATPPRTVIAPALAPATAKQKILPAWLSRVFKAPQVPAENDTPSLRATPAARSEAAAQTSQASLSEGPEPKPQTPAEQPNQIVSRRQRDDDRGRD